MCSLFHYGRGKRPNKTTTIILKTPNLTGCLRINFSSWTLTHTHSHSDTRTHKAVRAMVAERTRTDLQRAHLPPSDWAFGREHVCERGVRVPALQADRAAVRLPGAVPGRGGSAEPSLGHRGALLPVPVGVLLPVRGAAADRRGSVELLLHAHVR